MFTITEKEIKLNEQIEGVEIEAHYDMTGEVWVASDGYNSEKFESQEEAIAWLEEAVDFFNE